MNSKFISRHKQRASSSLSASIMTLTGPSKAQKITRGVVRCGLTRTTPTVTGACIRSVAVLVIAGLALPPMRLVELSSYYVLSLILDFLAS